MFILHTQYVHICMYEWSSGRLTIHNSIRNSRHLACNFGAARITNGHHYFLKSRVVSFNWSVAQTKI